MLYIGMDVHKKNLEVCVLDALGQRLQSIKVRNDKESVVRFVNSLDQPGSLALEPTHNWTALYDLLERLGLDVHVCHPRDAELIGKCRIKTDKNDAYKLAALLRAGFLPESYVPDPDGREIRKLVRSRSSLVRLGTQVKNQVHAVLRENWIEHDYSDLFGKGGREFLDSLKIDDAYKLVITSRLQVLWQIQEQIKPLDEEIIRRAYLDRRAVLLMTILGVGPFSALLILGEIGDIRRFQRAESLVNFSGLHPSEDSSGDTIRRGRITKRGSSWLRWILIQVVLHTIKQEGKIRDLYLRVLAKKGHGRAIVAAARELLVSIYWMLKRMEPFRPSGRKEPIVTGEAR